MAGDEEEPSRPRPSGGDFGALLQSRRDGVDAASSSSQQPQPCPSPPPRPAVGPDLRRGSPTRSARGPLTSDQVKEADMAALTARLHVREADEGAAAGGASTLETGAAAVRLDGDVGPVPTDEHLATSAQQQPDDAPPGASERPGNVDTTASPTAGGMATTDDRQDRDAPHSCPTAVRGEPPRPLGDEPAARPAQPSSAARPPPPSEPGKRAPPPPPTAVEDGEETLAVAPATTALPSVPAADDATSMQPATVVDPPDLPATTAPPRPASPPSASSVASLDEAAAADPPANGAPAPPSGAPSIRRFIVSTLAGKPVWSWPPQAADANSNLAAVAGALADYAAGRGDGLVAFDVGGGDASTPPTRVAVAQRGGLRFLAATAADEPDAALTAYLDALHAQLLAVLTTGLHRAVRRDPGLDAARLLAGAEPTLGSLVAGLDGPDAAVVCGAFAPLPLASGLRRAAADALTAAVTAGGAAGGGALLAGDLVVALARGTAPASSWSPGDVTALAHFIRGSPSLRRPGVEACAPVCLPGRDPSRLAHAYVRPVDVGGGQGEGTTLVLVGDRAAAFPGLARAGRAAAAALRRGGVLAAVAEAMASPGRGRLTLADPPWSSFETAATSPRPLHFALRSVTRGQVLASEVDPATPGSAGLPPPGAYARARAALRGSAGGLGFGPVGAEDEDEAPTPPSPTLPRLRTHWARRGALAVLGLAGPEYEVFATFDGRADPGAAAAVAAGLTAWVKGRAGDLFV